VSFIPERLNASIADMKLVLVSLNKPKSHGCMSSESRGSWFPLIRIWSIIYISMLNLN